MSKDYISYEDIGTGTPLLLIHGLGSKKEAWQSQHTLASNYRLVIPDLRGHGCSPITDGFTLSNFAEDLIKLLDSLGIEQTHICGLSLGGIVAQEILRLYPDRVRSLILANTLSYLPIWLGELAVSHRINALNKLGKEKYIRFIARNNLFDKTKVQEALTVFDIKDHYPEVCRTAIGCNYLDMLPLISKNVLVIGSRYDKVISPVASYQISLLANAELVVLESGHLSNLECPQEFNEAVSTFLQNHH